MTFRIPVNICEADQLRYLRTKQSYNAIRSRELIVDRIIRPIAIITDFIVLEIRSALRTRSFHTVSVAPDTKVTSEYW